MAAEALGMLHEAGRLYVNFFQPSFKLKSKVREGAKVTKKYHVPATPYERLSCAKNMSDLETLLHQSIGERGESG
jgi:hypothetical protein